MADSFLDTAGGLQQVPTVDVVEQPEQPYLTPAGSMQSALAVNVLSGGIPADGVALTEGEAVSILNADGSGQLAQGTADIDTSTDPNTLDGVTLPASFAVLQDSDAVQVNAQDGTVQGTMTVAANAVSGVTLPNTAALATDGMTLQIPVTGTYTDSVTLTVAGGVITAIELS